MNVGLNTLYDIGSNYSIKLNDKERLIYEDDSTRTTEKTDDKKRLDKDEKATEKKTGSSDELSQDEKRLVLDLQSRDAEVRAHESAHKSGGASTGAASYTYQQGPDGKMYAIGGEVSVSFKTGSTPQETIANAQAVIASALAPADPSGQDQAVASSAAMMISKTQQQIAKEKQGEIEGKEVYKDEAVKNTEAPNKGVQEDSLDITG